MIVTVAFRPAAIQATSGRDAAAPPQEPPTHTSADSMVDEMGKCSFPASDPPAVWTWDVAKRARPAERSSLG
jgi:hypothetical protein